MTPSEDKDVHSNELVVMTLNFQYFASYPKDLAAAEARLAHVLSGPQPPDIICVQEGIASKDVLTPVGFDLCVCAGRDGHAESVHNMVYGDEFTLNGCDESLHNELLCNQLYMRRGSEWEVHGRGSMQISSDHLLAGGGGRLEGKLAIRSMVWAKLRRRSTTGPFVYVMCTHITGGRFEDQYFVQQLAEERRLQPDRIIAFFDSRENPSADDVGIIVGDFNATTVYSQNGAMQGYFRAGIASSAGVKADAQEIGIKDEAGIEELFKTYMISPFTSISSHGWTFAYDRQHVGYTSGFGHCIDHMAMNRSIQVKSAKVIYLTNQKFGSKKDTDLILTDHNSVKAVFAVTGSKLHGRTHVLRTEYDFLRCLDQYKAIVHISGFGCKQQYDDIDSVVPLVAAALCDGPGSMDARFGKGKWVACFGGDPLDEDKPDIACLVHRLQQKYGVHLIAIQCDKVEKEWGGVDKHLDTVYYYPTEYKEDGVTVAWGGFLNGQPIGTTRILLETLSHAKLERFWLSVGGGDISADELCAAWERHVPILYMAAQARYPQDPAMPCGPCKTFWESKSAEADYEPIDMGAVTFRRKRE